LATEVSSDVLVGRVFLCRALGDESTLELSRVLRRVSEARREAGRPLLCWLVVDPQANVPSAAAGAALLKLTSSLLNHCESLTLIVIGDGLGQTLLRTSLRGLTTRPQTLRVRVVDGLEAAARIAGDPSIDLAQLDRAARSAGIVASLAPDALASP
jgi:hypothetical protein